MRHFKKLLAEYMDAGATIQVMTPSILLRGRVTEVTDDYMRMFTSNHVDPDERLGVRETIIPLHFILAIDATKADEPTEEDAMDQWYVKPPEPVVDMDKLNEMRTRDLLRLAQQPPPMSVNLGAFLGQPPYKPKPKPEEE